MWRKRAVFMGQDDQGLTNGVFAWARSTGPGGWRIEAVREDGSEHWTLKLCPPVGDSSQEALAMAQSIALPPSFWTIGAVRRYPPAAGLVKLMLELARRESARQPSPGSGWLVIWLSVAAVVISLTAMAVVIHGALSSPQSADGEDQSSALGPSDADVLPMPENELLSQAFGSRLSDDQLGPIGIEMLKDVVGRTGFSLNPRGQLVVMFADPLCPACQQFDSWIAKDGYKTFAPLIVPVSIRPESFEVAAGVLCSRDRAQAWRKAIAGAKLQSCEVGRRNLELNNALFAAMGFSSTPVFVATNGRFLTRARSPVEMAKWAEENAPRRPDADEKSPQAASSPAKQETKQESAAKPQQKKEN